VVGSGALATELGAGGAGPVVPQVVPFPRDAAAPVVAKYHAALKASAPSEQPGFVSFEGYLVGRTIAAILDKMNGEPTRKGFIEAVQKSGGGGITGSTISVGAGSNTRTEPGRPPR